MTRDERQGIARSTSEAPTIPAGGDDGHRPLAAIDRYQLLRRVGSGAMGVVFEAIDTARDQRVALKTLHKLDPSALYRLKNEFRTVADLNHPNLVTLHELVSYGGQWFMTMEFIDGVSIIDYVRREPTGIADRARDTLRQLARGLGALHSGGKLHRDVKSPNVLVDRSGRVVLLDFGLAADDVIQRLDATIDDGILGTPAYMSPEQACGEPPSQASDWYAVGIILYECLSGVLPYTGPTLKILADKQQRDPQPIAEVAPETPQDLATLCMGLLARDPTQRPGGAAILDRLVDDPQAAVTKLPEAPLFVGREGLLDGLHRAYAAIASGVPVTAYVHGPSGIGKTALVDQFLRELAATEDVVLLSGRCYERELVPYKAFDSLVDSLTRYLRRLPQVAAASLMPREIHALARIFPVLERVPVVLEAPRRTFEAPDQQELRRRAFRGLREILAKIADRRPLILRIEDMQWGDEDSARLLADLLAPPDPPALLLIGVYRNDEAASSPMLGELGRLYDQGALGHDIRNLAVGPLTAAESQALALALFGEATHESRDQAAQIADEADGSPLFVEALVRRVASTDGVPLGEHREISLEEVFLARLPELSATARAILEFLAIAGRPLRERLLLALSGDDDGDGRVALTQLRALHLVRSHGHHEETTIECYHDRIRETVAASLPAPRQRDRHRALAEALESLADADLEMLAQHFHSGGDTERAAHYAAAAAARAAAALAFNRAADLYRLARTWAPQGPDLARDLQVRHADALVQAGRCGEAAPLYLEAAGSVPSSQAIELRRRAAEQFLVSGHIDAGVTILRPLLASVRLAYPETPGRAKLSIIGRQTQLSLRGIRFTARDQATLSPVELLRVDVCWSAAKGLNFVDPIRGYAFALRSLLLALELGEPRRVARGLATVGMLMTSRAGASAANRGAALVREAEALARELDDPYILGLTQIIDGIANITLARWLTALKRFDSGIQRLLDRCAGIAWESSIAQMGTMRALLSIGRFRELKVRAQAWRREAEDAGDLYSEVWAALFGAYARVSEGEAEDARGRTRAAIDRWSQDGFHFQHLLALAVETLCDLYQGRPLAAWNRLQERWPAIEGSQILGWVFLRIFALQLRASTAIAAANVTPHEAPHLLGIAAAAADELSRHAGDRDDGRATAAAIRAGIAASHGDRRRTLANLEQAIAGYEAADMEMIAACGRRRLGELMGDEGGRETIAAADRVLRGQGIRDPKRWTTIQLPGFPDETRREG